MDTLLHAKSKLSTSISFEILKLCSLIAFSIITQELDFSQPCRFHRFPEATMVYHLKSKNHIDGPFFFFFFFCGKSVLPTLDMLD